MINRVATGLGSLVALAALVGCSAETPQQQDTAQPEMAQSGVEAGLTAAAWPAIKSEVAKSDVVESRVRDLLVAMSLEEKVGQIIQAEIQYVTPQDIKDYHVGSVLNGGGSLPNQNKYATPGEWLALADAYYEASMDTADGGNAIPIIWGSDAVHGHNNVIGATIFPHNIGLGAAHNPALMREIGEATALEMRATGIDWTFAPTLAVAQNDRWGRTYESYSEDPAVVRAYAGAMVRGLQGEPGTDAFLDMNHVVATAKHFLADGGTVDGDDQGNAVISEEELRDIHAAGYETAIEAGVQTAMASFSSWNGQKMHGNKYLLTDVLKDRMGLDGLIVGDWNGHGQVPGCTNASCPAAVNAGLDLFMAIEDWKDLYRNTLEQVKSGVIPMARLDDAVSRILRVKLRAGLFEKGLPSTRGVAGRDDIIGRDAHKALARRAVRESLVLLKNKGGLLPLAPGQTVLVAGDGADNIGKQSGGWTISWQGTGNVNSDFPGGQSVYGGIREAVAAAGGLAVLSEDGSFDEKPDVAIVVFGENPYAEGQGDLETLEFEPGAKRSLALLEKLKAQGIPVVAVFLSGRPLWVNPELNASDAFVAAWLPGSQAGGVADVLFADAEGVPRHDFAGRLSFSWPKTPLQDELNPHHEGYDPLFKLGYGLSYAGGGEGPADLPVDVAGVADAGPHTVKLFAGRPLAPWMMMLGDERNNVQLSGAYAALPSGVARLTVVDKDIQGDALRLEMLKAGEATLFLTAGPALDWSVHAANDGFISFDVRLGEGAAPSLALALECGTDCTLSVPLGDDYLSAKPGAWQRVRVPLSAFASEDGAFARISAPFMLTARDAGTVSVANILLELP
jgi:beta-glucosidase